MSSALAFPIAASAAVVATLGARALAARFGVVARPGPIVPQHTQPVPLLGGLAVAAGAAAALIVLGGRGLTAPVLVGSAGFVALGLLDDVRPLTVGRKLLGQVLLAAAAVGLGLSMPVSGSEIVDRALALAWIVAVVNAVNVTDVCDGLVLGLALIALGGAASLVEPGLTPLCLAGAGACLGVLVFNAPPASIFLGESGTGLLGFVLAAVTIESVSPRSLTDLASASLLVSVFLFEMTFLVAARARRGAAWWLGSADHFSLRLQSAGLSRWQTDGVAWFVGLCAALAAYALRGASPAELLAIVLLAFAVLGLAWRLLLRWPPAPCLVKPPAASGSAGGPVA